MKYDPEDEVAYRAGLARNFLDEGNRRLMRGDYRGTVESSQLAVENSAKAVVAIYQVPSWSHDPSAELVETVDRLPEGLKGIARKLAEIAHRLAPEHGRVTYGEPARGITPWEVYGRDDAMRTLSAAKEAVDLMEKILSNCERKPHTF